ncbi:MAG TPA: EAL domain-containing protein [Candidatus Limnocylindrales bacterium]
MARLKIAELLPDLRVGARPRDVLGRVQLLLLVLALANTVGALVVVLASGASPLILYVAGLAAPVAISVAWLVVYRRGSFGIVPELVVLGALCILAMAVDNHWNDVAVAVLAAAVFFGSAYGTLPRVLIRASGMAAIAVGLGLGDPNTSAISLVSAFGFMVVAGLMHGMATSIHRYEQTVRREQVLAAMGLDLVAAVELPAIAASAVHGAYALCAALPGVRICLAVAAEGGGDSPPFKVLGVVGRHADELSEAVLEVGQLAPVGQKLADQRLFSVRAADSKGGPDGPSIFAPGEVLVTRIAVTGGAGGVIVVESPGPINDELPSAMRALATQVALAVSRMDMQHAAMEREGARRFQALIQSSTDVICIVSAQGIVRYQSPSIFKIFGYDAEAMIGVDVGTLVHPDDESRLTGHFREVIGQPGASRVCECRLRHSDSSWRYTETRMTNMLDVPAVNGIVLNTRDVTERRNLEAELRHQAFHDSLTGLANRTLFANRVEHSLTSAKRDGSTIAVLYCDMDGFKRLNDSLGYTAGDTALVMTAERLQSCVRGQDTVARLGGDEFCVLLDRLGSPSDAIMAMERIMTALRTPLSLHGAEVQVQPNIGIAVSVGGDVEVEHLLQNAAVAMHQARQYEGGYALFDPEMHADAMRRIEVETQLRTAIAEQQFMMYYQPTIDLHTGRLTGVEALIRWQHPTRGIVPPMEFIPLAEESGLIVPMGRWAIQVACRQVRIWQKEIPANEPIALNVNLSARQLRHPNIVRDIADALDDSGLLPSRLILEITESVLMVDTAATLNRLFQLKSLGVRLAIDDFGTGYSSFAYLRRFPIDILKIDKSFVDGVATEPTSTALVDAMIRIGKTLRMETVAEGVELIEQADRLRTLQCDIGQGYLFSRPLPSDSITNLLRERQAVATARANAA